MTPNVMIDADTVGQMVAEGMEIVYFYADVGEGYTLKQWLRIQAQRGDAIGPLRQLMPLARDLLEDASILNDAGKQLRVSVAHDAISGLLSLYGIEA